MFLQNHNKFKLNASLCYKLLGVVQPESSSLFKMLVFMLWLGLCTKTTLQV